MSPTRSTGRSNPETIGISASKRGSLEPASVVNGVRLVSILVIALLAMISGAGCTGAPSPEVDLTSLLRSRGLDPSTVVQPFAITSEMAQWAHEQLSNAPNATDPLDVLLQAVLEERELSVEYEWAFTGTAIEVFEERRANCLGFANLLVGLGREIGVATRFLLVEEVDNVQREGDLVVLAEHATVGYGPASQRKVLAFSLNAEEFYRDAEPISDLTAIALFYSNRGAEAVRTGDLSTAVEYLEIAVRVDPALAQAWVNLGVASRRSNDMVRAEEAYLRALEIDPKRTSAYQNLAALLRISGDLRAAEEIMEIVGRLGTPDPYAYLNLAEIALDRGRSAEAERFFRKALARGRNDAEVQAAVGLWKFSSGRPKAARRHYNKAVAIDPSGPRVLMLGHRLDGGGSGNVVDSVVDGGVDRGADDVLDDAASASEQTPPPSAATATPAEANPPEPYATERGD